MSQHIPILSIIILFLGALLTIVLGRKNQITRNLIVTIVTLTSFGLVLSLFKPIVMQGKVLTYWIGDWKPFNDFAIGIGLEIDMLSFLFGIMIVISMFVSIIASINYMNKREHAAKYFVLTLMFSGSILGMVFISDLFNMFIMLQIAIMSGGILIAFNKSTEENLNIGLKFIINQFLGGLLILFGIVLLYIQCHTLNIPQLVAMMHNNFTPVTLFAFATLLGGFVINTGMFPMHSIVVESSAIAPTPVSIMFNGMLNKFGIYMFIRVLFFIYSSMELKAMNYLLIIWGGLTMLVLAIVALREQDIRKSIIYQGISEIGLAILAIGVSTTLGLTGGLYHLLNQTIFIGLLLLCIGVISNKTGTTDIRKLGGLRKRLPGTLIIFIIGAFSLSGIPPFNGFISKLIIYRSCNNIGLGFLGITILLASIVAIANMFRIIIGTFGGELPKEYENIGRVGFYMKLPMWFMSILCILLGVVPNYIVKYLINPGVSSIINIEGYIDSAMGGGYALRLYGESIKVKNVAYMETGFHNPIAWLAMYIIVLIIITIIAGVTAKNKEEVKDYLPEKVNNGFIKASNLISKSMDFIKKTNDELVKEHSLLIVATTSTLLVFLFIFV